MMELPGGEKRLMMYSASSIGFTSVTDGDNCSCRARHAITGVCTDYHCDRILQSYCDCSASQPSCKHKTIQSKKLTRKGVNYAALPLEAAHNAPSYQISAKSEGTVKAELPRFNHISMRLLCANKNFLLTYPYHGTSVTI